MPPRRLAALAALLACLAAPAASRAQDAPAVARAAEEPAAAAAPARAPEAPAAPARAADQPAAPEPQRAEPREAAPEEPPRAAHDPAPVRPSAEGGAVAAGPGESLEAPMPSARRRHYHDGPRRVPTPRGRDLARARRLGLGTARTVERLLFSHAPPEPIWVIAAGGRRPRTFLWPIRNGRFLRGYGDGAGGTHPALDIGAHCGAPIRASHSGIVAYSDNGVRGLGNAVVLVGAGGYVTVYGHARRTLVPAGARVRRGQAIAEVGDTGIADACHVHYELRRNGRLMNPERLLVDRGTGDVRTRAARRRAAAVVYRPHRRGDSRAARTLPPRGRRD